ncbi:hypothetical protein K1T71_001716 [Dendrolimus kikuchii]|uniref:Uncharacterized protein n=1 Tax=Dendrolimus kikuchii TaxID=765133 RepID=A0ACC1DFZ3_9NEOP|nr:hypothetical protein K1T71_001716 [Dendrolimus kikuchii]
METLPATQDDSSGANPSSIKSGDSSPGQNSGRSSPPPNCAICLGTCKNKSFTDSCLHQFCFKCLLTWSKVKAVCPLCKQNFRSIIHNVRSNDQYEEYMVEQRQTEEGVERLLDIDTLTIPTRRFRYRTTFTLPRRETIAIQQLLLHYPLVAEAFPRSPPRRRRSPASFRRTVYRHNLWARPLPDFTGRFRDCSPEFYRYNETQMHRLVPWLDRELHYLLNENLGHISYVLNRILELLRQYHMNSFEFRDEMRRYLGDRTEHFLHEMYCFASTPYDMTGYDRNVQYTTDTRISTMVNEIISSSDSEASVDSDIMMVSSSEPSEVHAGPSRTRPASATASAPAPAPAPAPAYPHHYIPTPLLPMSTQPPPLPPTQNVIPIETISQSDSDDDSSEVMVVGYIKPPQDRTPEVVDLLGSDSDVVVQESPQPERSSEAEQSRLLVKLSMKMHRARENGNSDSDDSYRPPAPAKRRRTTRSADAATTTSDTCRTTPSPTLSTLAPQSPAPANLWDNSGASSSSSRDWSSSSSLSSNTTSSSSDSSSAEDDSSWSDANTKKSKVSKRKTKKKSSKDSNANRSRKKSKKRVSHTRHKSKKDRCSKRKSYSGKGIKSSKKSNDSNDGNMEAQPYTSDEPQPGPSGTASNQKHKSRGKSTKKGMETVGISTLIQNIQNDLEQLRQSGTSGHQKQKSRDKSSKKCKETVDVSTIVHNTQKNLEEQQPVDFCTTIKQKNTKELDWKTLNYLPTPMQVKNHTNEDQQPGPSGTSSNHKQKSVREKTTKKNKETVNVSTLVYEMQNNKEQEPINKGLISKEKPNGDPVLWRPICIKSNTNEDEQPGPSGISANHKHRSNREKCSKKHDAVQPTASAQMAKDEDQQPGPSGTSSNHKAKSSREKSLKKYKESSPNLMQSNEDEPVSSYKHKSSRDRNRRLPSRENKRLKSVVNIMYSNSNKNASEIDTQGSPGGHSNTSSNHTYSDGRARKVRYESPPPPSSPATRPPSSDSEDDLPLNLTIQNLISHTSLSNKEQMYK